MFDPCHPMSLHVSWGSWQCAVTTGHVHVLCWGFLRLERLGTPVLRGGNAEKGGQTGWKAIEGIYMNGFWAWCFYYVKQNGMIVYIPRFQLSLSAMSAMTIFTARLALICETWQALSGGGRGWVSLFATRFSLRMSARMEQWWTPVALDNSKAHKSAN